MWVVYHDSGIPGNLGGLLVPSQSSALLPVSRGSSSFVNRERNASRAEFPGL